MSSNDGKKSLYLCRNIKMKCYKIGITNDIIRRLREANKNKDSFRPGDFELKSYVELGEKLARILENICKTFFKELRIGNTELYNESLKIIYFFETLKLFETHKLFETLKGLGWQNENKGVEEVKVEEGDVSENEDSESEEGDVSENEEIKSDKDLSILNGNVTPVRHRYKSDILYAIFILSNKIIRVGNITYKGRNGYLPFNKFAREHFKKIRAERKTVNALNECELYHDGKWVSVNSLLNR